MLNKSNNILNTLNGSGESSYVDEVYDSILLKIIRGELTGGAELKSTQLAQALGVSRTPVVQALQRLAADGIVTLEVNRRAVLCAWAENWLVEIHALRELLEPAAAAAAAERISDEAIKVLQEMAVAALPGEDSGWMLIARQFDYALHLAIADHCGNLPLREAIRRCWSFKRLSYEAVPEQPALLERDYREHLLILDALAAHDPPSASSATLFHLRSASRLRPLFNIV